MTPAAGDLHHDRAVVAPRAGGVPRAEDRDAGSLAAVRITGTNEPHARPRHTGLQDEIAHHSAAVIGPREPHLARREVAQDGGHAGCVIVVRVGHDDRPEAYDPHPPESGAHDALPHVEGAPRRPSRVHQDALAARGLDQDGVSLTNVQHRDAQTVRRPPRVAGHDD